MHPSSDGPDRLPFVSVIVPVYNDAARIHMCIAALLAQTYPRERYEVLVVDNGSTDDTRAVVARFPVTLLVEDTTKGSYAARNTGLAQAHGDIIAFTDSDCTPSPAWLAEGVHAMHAQQADLVGGHVRFVTSPRPSGAEIQDAIANLRVERYIREDGAAVTANLFVRAGVFDAIGRFPLVLSGGDKMFTQRATQAGFRLVYAPAAEVAHPTRRLGALLKKQFRVGKGHHAMRASRRAAPAYAAGGADRPAGRSKGRKILHTVKGMLPESFGVVRQSMVQHNMPLDSLLLVRVWAAAWLARAATTLGSLSQSVAHRRKVAPHVQRSDA